jgi:benzoate-CoA ligase family protein
MVDVPERFNLAEHFVDRHIAAGHGAKTAIVCEGRSLSYAEVLALVNRTGNGLRALGVEPGDRVLLVLPDGPEFAAAYFGAAKIGAVAVPTSTALHAADYPYFLDESQARVLVVDESLWPRVEAAARERSGLCRVIAGGGQWNSWLAGQSAELDAAPTGKDDSAFWLWTSGSTGSPKAAVHQHGDWVYCCEYYARGVLGIGPEDRTFSSSKLFHAYGLGNALLFPFYVGATTVLYPGRAQARVILERTQQLRPTLFFSVPTLYAAMLAETDRENPYRLESVRLGVSAAEPLPAEIYRRWRERFGFEVLDGLGSTEALHVYVSARAGEVRPGSSGRVVEGYEVRLSDDGDLWVRGESVARCYWNRPELSAARMQEGWFFTGDKYRQDSDGYLWYAGRSDDMFRVSGEWVSPVEVEAALVAHPAVLESAVVRYTDEHGLTKPKAYVVLKPGRAPEAALSRELQEFVKRRIAPYKYPRRIEFLPELPKTATGKIQRFKLRE